VSWRSPWRHRWAVAGLETARRLLRLLGRDETPLLRAVVADNNRRVHRYLAGRPVRSVLLILPRCVKRGCCEVDRSGTLEPCLDCRRCRLGDLARLARRQGVEALVAYRSHIAFAMARERRPDLILASACEDRLLKALRSVPEIPALLSPLTGMHRRCVDADFDLAWFEGELRSLLGKPRREEGHVSHAQAGL